MRASADGQRGTCVVATRALARGTMLLFLPKAAVLSVRSASNSKVLAALMDDGLDQDAALNLAIAHERGRGRTSHWWPYLCTLPAAEPLPFLWSAAELRLLAGTGLDTVARERRAQLAREHAQLRTWCKEHHVALPALEAYLAAASLASSRAFFVDGHHGEALVPGADCFNHAARLLPEGCEVEGGEEEDDEGDEEGDEEGERLANAHRRAAARAVAVACGLELRMDTTLHNLGDEGVGMAAMRQLRRGAEVFNTYGEHPNCVLLANYGFALRDNPLDTAPLGWGALRAALSRTLGGSAARRRERALRATGRWGAELGSAPFIFDLSGRPPVRLLRVAWLFCASEEEANGWMLGGASEEGEEQEAAPAAAFAQLPPTAQLAPPHTSACPRSLLLAAVRAQVAQLPTAARHAGPRSAARAEVAQSAATLVAGQRAVWRAAEGFLASVAPKGKRAPRQSRGISKRGDHVHRRQV